MTEDFFHIIDQLELAKTFLSESDQRAKIGLILIDNLAEILTQKALVEIIKPSISLYALPQPANLIKNLEREFASRVEFISINKSSVISPRQALLLQIGHNYRNDVYHRNVHNPKTIHMIGKIYFKAVSELFVNIQPSYGFSPVDLTPVRKYDVQGNTLDFQAVSRKAKAGLLNGMRVSMSKMVKALKADLSDRVDSLGALIADGLPVGDIDKIIADYEFESIAAPKSKELYEIAKQKSEILREITTEMRGGKMPLNKRLGELTSKHLKLHQSLRSKYSQEISSKDLKEVKSTLNGFTLEKRRGNVLEDYFSADKTLSKLETYLFEAAGDYEQYIGSQIDEMRGK